MSVLEEIILVTGGSGYVGSTTLKQLLTSNYTHIKTTVRDSGKQECLISTLKNAGVTVEQLKHLQFYFTDLLNDAGWKEAFEGVKYLLHIASPIATFEKDKVKTAKEGTLRVLRFARDNGVKRVIVTSSGLTFIPLVRGSPIEEYHESKIVADNAVWEFLEKEGEDLELISVHPRIIFGPVLGPENARQVGVLHDFLNGKTPPMASHGGPVVFVDVRDVADLHIRALTAANQNVGRGQGKVRLLGNADEVATWTQISRILHDKLPVEYGKNVPLIPEPQPDGPKHPHAHAQDVPNTTLSKALGWKPHTVEETVLDTAKSLITLGLVKK